MRMVGYGAAIAGGVTVWLIEMFIGLAVVLTLGGVGEPLTPAPSVSTMVTSNSTHTETTPSSVERPPSRVTPTPVRPIEAEEPVDEPEAVYYASCAEARQEGAAPLVRGAPGYRPGLDRDGDGRACE